MAPFAPTRLAPLSERLVGKLWVMMGDFFGSRWEAQHGATDADGTWASGLAGLTGEDIAAGMRVLADSGAEWPPALPEFRAMCEPTPDRIGAPDVAVAFREACCNAHPAATRRWSHSAVFHAALQVGFQRLLLSGEERIRQRFDKCYRDAVRLVLSGGELAQPPADDVPALPKLVDPAVAAANLQAMREILSKGAKHAR